MYGHCVFLCSSVRLTRLSPVWKPWPRCLTIRAALWHTAKHRCDKTKKPNILHYLMIMIFIFYYTNSWHWSVLSCWSKGPEMEVDTLLCKISALVSLLSSLEIKVCLCWVILLLIVDKTHMARFVRGKSFMSHVWSDTTIETTYLTWYSVTD